MARDRFWSLLTLSFVIFSLGFGSSPASAAAPRYDSQLSAHPKQLPEDAVSLRGQRVAGLPGGATVQADKHLAQPFSACSPGWRVVDAQDYTWNNFLSDVSAATPTDIWAVGSRQDPTTGALRNMGQHWDGTAWTLNVLATHGPEDEYENGVVAIDATNIWVVGVAHMNGVPEGAFTKFGGGSSINSYDPNPVAATVLNDVGATGPNNVFMVGAILAQDSTGAYVWQTLIKWYDGVTFHDLTTPNVGTGNNTLFGIDVVSATDMWAVGYYRATPTSARRTLYLHSADGQTWTVVPSPNAIAGDNTIIAIASASSSDFWAVGYTGPLTSGGLLLEHWASGTWSVVTPPSPGGYTNFLSDVFPTGPTSYMAVGGYAQSTNQFSSLVAQYNGASWGLSNAASTGSSDTVLSGGVAAAPGDIWAVGDFIDNQPLDRSLIENYSGLASPTSVTATGANQSATVSWATPCSDGGSPITSYVVSAYDGCSLQGEISATGSPVPTTANFSGLTNGVSYTFKVSAVNGFGRGPASSATLPTVPSGSTVPSHATACSNHQFQLSSSDGSTWHAMDPTNLTVSFTPAVDSYAVLGGNADLWTTALGYNQDIGISVGGGAYPSAPGQPEAWKESGGYSGTFSPNAAYVQAVIPVAASTVYTAKLTWKANKPDPGSILAGAGPIRGAFSPTRLTVQLIPKSAGTVFVKTSTSQYGQNGLGGASTSWLDVDANKLKLSFTPPTGNWNAFISGNADLWTPTAGYNQDIGVSISGGAYPPVTGGQPQAWKESGGLSGTYSPNAAFVEAPFAVSASTTYTAELQWKANQPDPYYIYAGAGPIGGRFSPTTLVVILMPVDPTVTTYAPIGQATLPNSDGEYWATTIGGSSALLVQVTPSADADYELSLNADLWTSVPGYNQDLAIMVSAGAYGAFGQFSLDTYGSGTVVAWKESGGGSAYSPNAAYVTAVVHLQAGTTYWIFAVWKANRLAQASNAIWAGAGPEAVSQTYSPSWIAARQLS